MPITDRTPAQPGFTRRFIGLAGGYWAGDKKWTVRLLTGALGLLTVGQVVVPILINLWSQRLFDALEQRSMDRFMTMIAAVGGIILFNIANTILHLRVKRRIQLGWRTWLTDRLLNDWLSRGRQHQVTYLPGDHDNPDGRIAEDIRISTEVAIDLGLSLSYCAMLLISFTNILWMLSGAPEVTVAGITFHMHGYLLYIALLYAAIGTTIALVMGKPLVNAVNRRQGHEASFRFGLARVRENAQAVALLHGESGERGRLFGLFQGVRRGWIGQTRALSNMMIFSATYSVLSSAFPILVAAPSYIAGHISLGVLMQTAQAFQQTVGALSWPIDNLARAAEWKASVERVLGLHEALQRLDREIGGEGTERIVVDRTDDERWLSFTDLSIADPDGRRVLEPFTLEIKPGERVLISGDPAAAVRLFRAVARVWPWGSGRIALPAHTRVFFMPERPYLPHDTLRAALSYPVGPEMVSDHAARAAMERVGLSHLLPQLDENEAWDEILAVPEQQRLGFARLLIRRPDWIFVEDATDSLDPDSEEAMLRLIDEEFPKATLITIGSHAGLEAHHRRKLVLERFGDSVHLREEPCGNRERVVADVAD
ncbi:ABC transporter ATP-binding protein/permease [Azospirillum rugosum]|uniref:ATP-binding cassette transporter n=1 Tax=Azospirillum rugosum TaxID=416170 RepID=A0ABS4SHC6_9PROT|nr:ABC transporter ATP-binding protein/permease [Azospirillum rugosum]MBP2291352.1 putative ATP-binding cassette transporter [Azospirillum rugosum]MDQ0525140.1 putative ATP-binding cassette transporter [Azospirillum rugosum]